MPRLSILFLSVIMLFGCQFSPNTDNQVIINGQSIKTEIVKEVRDMVKGLSGRKSLCPDCGLLFVYPDYQVRTFWMKGMNFPLDIVWLKDEIIAGFEENIPPFNAQGQISRMLSNEPVNLVLELNAGWIGQNQIKIGDKVTGLDL